MISLVDDDAAEGLSDPAEAGDDKVDGFQGIPPKRSLRLRWFRDVSKFI
jgi:hypothetical protein